MNILISASVPSPSRHARFERGPRTAECIKDAIVAIARRAIATGHAVVFGGHPTISPLVSMVAGEYVNRVPAEGASLGDGRERTASRVIIYQSEVFRRFLPDETWAMGRLGLCEIRWTPGVGDERFDPELRAPQCAESLRLMRESMLRGTRPAAIVCIGGMEGVELEFALFRDLFPNRPAFALETTGGAARLIARRSADLSLGLQNSVRVPDGPDLMQRFEEFRHRALATLNEARQRSRAERDAMLQLEGDFFSEMPPFPWIADRILEAIG